MFLKRWMEISRNKNALVSLSLSSPRGTTAARNKNNCPKNRFVCAFVRYMQQKRGFLEATTTMVLLVIATVFLAFFVVAGIFKESLTNHGSFAKTQRQQKQRSILSSLSSISRWTGSETILHTMRRPRGHRYFDYQQDEDHSDFEPFPWKFMKRSSSSSYSNQAASESKRDLESSPPPPPIDDESLHFVPTGRTSEEVLYNDRSPFYAKLRQSYESFFPPPLGGNKDSEKDHGHDPNAERCLQAVEDLRTYSNLQTHLSPSNPNPDHSASLDHLLHYDIHDCPEFPPKGYPVEWNLVNEVLSQWPADDPELPASGTLYQGLCVFDFNVGDYETTLSKALNYRNAEVPFVVRGDPRVAQTVERWNAPQYLQTLIGDIPQGTETSSSAKFTYWTTGGVDTSKYPLSEYNAPTELKEMTFLEWLELANVTDPQLLMPESPHYYFRVVGCAPGTAPSRNHHSNVVDNSCSMLAGNTEHVPYLADELPFYTQTKQSLYVKEPLSEKNPFASKALNCRFGMKGVMATNHFDGERNFVTVLSGERRYLLAHPEQCGNMALFPYGHPSARHSAVDWANPDLEKYPEFEKARGNEVVLQAGDSLFLPSLWFHYIVSLSMNVQCNTRSGMDQRYVKVLDDSCGW